MPTETRSAGSRYLGKGRGQFGTGILNDRRCACRRIATQMTSIIGAIRFAREHARTLRPMISTEMWVQQAQIDVARLDPPIDQGWRDRQFGTGPTDVIGGIGGKPAVSDAAG